MSKRSRKTAAVPEPDAALAAKTQAEAMQAHPGAGGFINWAECVLRCSDMDATVTFYVNVLSFGFVGECPLWRVLVAAQGAGSSPVWPWIRRLRRVGGQRGKCATKPCSLCGAGAGAHVAFERVQSPALLSVCAASNGARASVRDVTLGGHQAHSTGCGLAPTRA